MFRPGTVSSSVIFASMKPCLIWTKSEKMPCASFDTAKRSRKLENCGELKMQAAVGPAGKSTPLTWFASGLISFRSVFTCKRVPLDFCPFWAGLDVSPRISKIHFKWKKRNLWMASTTPHIFARSLGKNVEDAEVDADKCTPHTRIAFPLRSPWQFHATVFPPLYHQPAAPSFWIMQRLREPHPAKRALPWSHGAGHTPNGATPPASRRSE
jgi:hypothetical protein